MVCDVINEFKILSFEPYRESGRERGESRVTSKEDGKERGKAGEREREKRVRVYVRSRDITRRFGL